MSHIGDLIELIVIVLYLSVVNSIWLKISFNKLSVFANKWLNIFNLSSISLNWVILSIV